MIERSLLEDNQLISDKGSLIYLHVTKVLILSLKNNSKNMELKTCLVNQLRHIKNIFTEKRTYLR